MDVLSREYLINQGECCGEGCLMCPYEPENKKGGTDIKITPTNLCSGFHKKYKND